MKLSRRRFLGMGVATLAAAGLGGYARLVEPGWLELVATRVALPAAPPSPLRLLYLSDLHWSRAVPAGVISSAVAQGIAARPDVICLGGDFVTIGDYRPVDELGAILAPLAQAAPTFAVTGNHDGGAWSARQGSAADTSRVTAVLQAAGIRVLEDEAVALPTLGLTVVGLRDLWHGQMDPVRAFAGVGRVPGPVVLLAHNPDTKDAAADQPWHLMVSGHTHGGQIVMPFVGPPVVPVNDRRYIAGLKPWGERQIYVSRGVGNLRGWRFHCRPEISLLELA